MQILPYFFFILLSAIWISFVKIAYDFYGHLILKALKELPREKIQLATKFGIADFDPVTGTIIKGTPEYVRSCCEASLKRLDVEYIDLYYQHRVDTSVPIEETVSVCFIYLFALKPHGVTFVFVYLEVRSFDHPCP